MPSILGKFWDIYTPVGNKSLDVLHAWYLSNYLLILVSPIHCLNNSAVSWVTLSPHLVLSDKKKTNVNYLTRYIYPPCRLCPSVIYLDPRRVQFKHSSCHTEILMWMKVHHHHQNLTTRDRWFKNKTWPYSVFLNILKSWLRYKVRHLEKKMFKIIHVS